MTGIGAGFMDRVSGTATCCRPFREADLEIGAHGAAALVASHVFVRALEADPKVSASERVAERVRAAACPDLPPDDPLDISIAGVPARPAVSAVSSGNRIGFLRFRNAEAGMGHDRRLVQARLSPRVAQQLEPEP